MLTKRGAMIMTTSKNKLRPEVDIYPMETNLCFDQKDISRWTLAPNWPEGKAQVELAPPGYWQSQTALQLDFSPGYFSGYWQSQILVTDNHKPLCNLTLLLVTFLISDNHRPLYNSTFLLVTFLVTDKFSVTIINHFGKVFATRLFSSSNWAQLDDYRHYTKW